MIAGWWFGTFLFPYIGNNNPNWLIFFRGVAQPPTRLALAACFLVFILDIPIWRFPKIYKMIYDIHWYPPSHHGYTKMAMAPAMIWGSLRKSNVNGCCGQVRNRFETGHRKTPSGWTWVCLKIVYPYTQWFCWSLSLLNGYFIGGIPHFQTYPLLCRSNQPLGT